MMALSHFVRCCTTGFQFARLSLPAAYIRCMSSFHQRTTLPPTSHDLIAAPLLPRPFELPKPQSFHPSSMITAKQQTIFGNGGSVNLSYQLPTVWYNIIMKKSILDPLPGLRAYELPTLDGSGVIKEMPTGFSISGPVADPQTTPVVDIVMLPRLMTIRHKKMKKHQLRKLRKRMRFVLRRRRVFKAKRREQQILAYEQKMAKEGADYNAEKYVEKQLLRAQQAGWGIDIVAEYARKRATTTPNDSNISK